MNWPTILLHLWLVPAVYFLGEGRNNFPRSIPLALGWPVMIPLYWLLNRWTR